MDIRILEKHCDTLAESLQYPSQKRHHLSFALKLSCVKGHIFFHSGLEAVGRAMIDAVHTHYLFTRGYHTEKEISAALQRFARKHTVVKLAKACKLQNFIYNNDTFYQDAEDNSTFPVDQEEALVYRIVGAMYYDAGYEAMKDWIINHLGIRALKKEGSIEGTK